MSTDSTKSEMTLKGSEIEYKKKNFKADLLILLRSQLVYFSLV